MLRNAVALHIDLNAVIFADVSQVVQGSLQPENLIDFDDHIEVVMSPGLLTEMGVHTPSAVEPHDDAMRFETAQDIERTFGRHVRARPSVPA